MHNSGHGLALCHVFDMSFLGIVHIAASYGRNPASEIPQRYYQDDNQSLMMHECILVDNCVCSFNIKAPLFMYPIDQSDYGIQKTLTNDSKKELVVSSETYSSECFSEDDTMTRRFKNSK